MIKLYFISCTLDKDFKLSEKGDMLVMFPVSSRNQQLKSFLVTLRHDYSLILIVNK